MFTFMNSNCSDECVYKLIEQTVDNRSRGPPIYRSRFSCMVRQEANYNKTGCYKTMGVPKTCLCPPQNYLKKHSRAPITVKAPQVPRIKLCNPPPETCPDSKQDDPCSQQSNECGDQSGTDQSQNPCETQANDGCGGGNNQPITIQVQCEPQPKDECGDEDSPPQTCDPCQPPIYVPKSRVPRICCNIMKPAVPGPCIGLEVIPRGCKNYIHSNIVKALRMPARKASMKFVDHPRGNTQAWTDSGYPRRYVYKDTFGCVPNYINDIKEELKKDDLQAKYDMKFKERDVQNQIRHLDPTEHQALVCGLKKNWDEKFAEFQSMSLLIDTMGKVKKKTELEEELKRLEKDIQLLERHDHIFVSDTCRSFYLA